MSPQGTIPGDHCCHCGLRGETQPTRGDGTAQNEYSRWLCESCKADEDLAPTRHELECRRAAKGEVHRSTGHRYHDLELAVEDFPAKAALDLVRLIRNLKDQLLRSEQKRRRGQTW